MESFIAIIFWSGIFLTFYTYIFYGLIVQFLLRLKSAFYSSKDQINQFNLKDLPAITVIIAAYNEEDFIANKIDNTLKLDYPKEKLNVWIVADGSNDNTVSIASAYKRVNVFFSPERKGKIHAVNRVMPKVETPVTIFTDANTFLNNEALLELVHPFSDANIGVVAGEKKILSTKTDSAVGAGEGFYWRYESWLKAADAQLGSTMGAAGELFAIRTSLFKEIDSNTLIEDFVLSLQIAAKGYKIEYAPKAVASELPSASMNDEQKRKIRIAAGGLQAVWLLRNIMNPFKYPLLAFQFISHRALRWTLAPLSLPFIFFSNYWLMINTESIGYQLVFALQALFYSLAGVFYYLREKNIKSKVLFIPYYFTIMNLCVYKGLIKLIKNEQSVKWDKAKRRKIQLAN